MGGRIKLVYSIYYIGLVGINECPFLKAYDSDIEIDNLLFKRDFQLIAPFYFFSLENTNFTLSNCTFQ